MNKLEHMTEDHNSMEVSKCQVFIFVQLFAKGIQRSVCGNVARKNRPRCARLIFALRQLRAEAPVSAQLNEVIHRRPEGEEHAHVIGRRFSFSRLPHAVCISMRPQPSPLQDAFRRLNLQGRGRRCLPELDGVVNVGQIILRVNQCTIVGMVRVGDLGRPQAGYIIRQMWQHTSEDEG
jgi:hypothetical protein